MKQHLQSKGFAFESREVPGGDIWQIFVRDPNGVMIELNYDVAAERHWDRRSSWTAMKFACPAW